MKFQSNAIFNGTITANSVADAGTNTGKFLVLNSSGVVTYRTAAELYADLNIGALPAGYTSTIKHEVKAGVAINKGQAVYVSSSDGTNMIVSKASNAAESTSSKTMGLLETTLAINGKGNVVTEGLLAGLDTTGATNPGDPVWLGTNGDLIYGLINKPSAPAHLVFIGIVTRINANNGEIFVKVQNGFELGELHNYAENGVANNDVIVWESATSLYKPKSIPTILGYTPVPTTRTLTINGTAYDLSADRAWTITTDASARSILRYVATAGQTTFTISGGYTPGLVDAYLNGVKLDNTTDFTATNGTTIVLTNAAAVNDVLEVYRYQTAFVANNALRVITEFTATAGQTTFTVTYNSGLVDIFYNGSKLSSAEYTASNGTSIILNFACNLNDIIEVHAYSYQVGAFTGQAQLNGTGFVKVSGTTVSYDNSTYLTTATAASTYLTISTAASTYQTILTNPVTGTGTTNYHAKFTGTNTIGNSLIFDNGTNLGIGTSGATYASTTLLLRATSATSTNYSFIVEDNATNQLFAIRNTGAATFSSSVQSAGLVSSKAANDTVRETNAAAWIGDLSAQDGLMIQNLASAPYGTALQVGGYGSNYAANYPMILQPRGGNVGIGTTSFSYSATGRGLLEVNGTSGQSALIGLKQGDVASGYLYGDNGNMILWAEGSRNLQIGIASAGNMLFSTNNTERMRITSGGDIEFKGGAVRANGGYFRVADSAGTTTSGYLIRESVWLGSGTSSNLALAAENPTGSIAFFTGGTAIEKMRISSAGVVTRPYQPFVMGGLNGNQSIPSTTFTTLNFDTTVGGFFYANVGSSWNNSTRTFTAPVTGIYMVTVSLMTDSVGQLAMFVNGTRKHSIPTPPFSGSITWGGTCMIPLNAGESLTLQGYGNAGTVTQNQYHTWFAIYLL